MTAHALARRYLTALERGDLPAILKLFHPDAIVHSPLYGPLPAAEFYPRLLTGTSRSELALRGVTQHANLVSIWFRYHWTLPSGTVTDFECVDILELDDHGQITALRIFYDTAATRPAFERETGTSWQPPPQHLSRARLRSSSTPVHLPHSPAVAGPGRGSRHRDPPSRRHYVMTATFQVHVAYDTNRSRLRHVGKPCLSSTRLTGKGKAARWVDARRARQRIWIPNGVRDRIIQRAAGRG